MTPVNSVLLLEDNPDHVLLIQTVLEECPDVQQVMVLTDGEQALSYVRAQGLLAAPGDLPGLVVLDLKLPKVDGLDVLRAMRASPQWCKVPVAVLTTSTRPSDEAASYSNGANAYLVKVVQPADLYTHLLDVVAQWLGRESGWECVTEKHLPLV